MRFSQMSPQTRIIVACAIVLAGIDISVRFLTMPRNTSHTDVVTAREYRLTDDNGNIRATISLDKNGEPGMRMYDRHGDLRLQLDTYQTTPSLIFFDEGGNKRAYYGMGTPNGDGELSWLSADGRTVGSMKMQGDSPNFRFYNADGSTRISMDAYGTVENVYPR